MIRWQKHCEKGVTDIRRDRRKDGWTEVFYKSCLVAAKNTRCRPDDFGLGSEVVVCNTGITWSINATLTPKLSLHCLILCNGGGGLRYCVIIVGKFCNRLKNVTRYSCLTTVISAILLWDVARIDVIMYEHIQLARFMIPTWGPPGTDRTQVGPMNLVIRPILIWSRHLSATIPNQL